MVFPTESAINLEVGQMNKTATIHEPFEQSLTHHAALKEFK